MIRIAAVGMLVIPNLLAAQATPARLTVRVESEGMPLVRAQVSVDGQATAANAGGVARIPLSAGEHLVRVRLIGYKPDSMRVTMPAGRDTAVTFTLVPAAEELEQMFVTSTRGVKRLEAEPTRIEVLGGDDVAEKTEMRPQDLKGFLTEMPGVRMQQTSAATGAAGVRLQGLRPRYTLLLADGLPSYGSGGGGLDLLQAPPADLRQIEVIKGPASALYGPSALGGTINLVSKRPAHESDYLAHATSAKGYNGFGWVSNKVSDRFGYTGVVGVHGQDFTDADGDTWAEMPKTQRVELRPRLFWDSPSGGTALVTAGGTFENREGGFMNGGRAPDGSTYVETADTRRGDVGIIGSRVVGQRGVVQFRGSFNHGDIARSFGGDDEHSKRSTGFGEVAYSSTRDRHELLAGVAFEGDFAHVTGVGEVPTSTKAPIDYHYTTPAVFVQDAWKASDKVSFTGSARVDAHSEYGTWLSPRLSMLYTPVEDWSLRFSGTHGFYAPTPFVEEADPIGVHKVNGFEKDAPARVSAEHADYGSVDAHGTVGPFELNGTVFGSVIRHPVLAVSNVNGRIDLSNAVKSSTSRGLELFGVYDLDPLYITALYSYTDARELIDPTSTIELAAPYAPHHAGGVDITWEDAAHGTWIALESFYTSRQRLTDDPSLSVSKPYTVTGLLASQRFGRFKVFANIENLTNVRQTDYEPLVLPFRALDGRWTVTPWAPLEGRVFSIGARVSGGEK